MNNEIKVWGIHNTNSEKKLLNESIIAIGWDRLGDVSSIQTREELKEKYKVAYSDVSNQSIANSAGQVFRFLKEAKIGDYVVFPSKFNRKINIGKIIGDYEFDNNESEYPHFRKVKWLKKDIERAKFTQNALYEVGSFLSWFLIQKNANEFIEAANDKFKSEVDNIEEYNIVDVENILELTKDYVLKTLKTFYKGYDLELIIKDLLNAMGYKIAEVSNRGGDRGIDLTVYKDELPPRIIVQVKTSDSQTTEKELQQLKGTMKSGDYGFFVSLSGYCLNANMFLADNPHITAINGDKLVDLILKYYEFMSDKFKNKIKLQKIYVPQIDEISE